MSDVLIVTNPPIENLLRLAKEEQNIRMQAMDYKGVIAVLMKKGFSSRKIIEWLEDNGAGRYSPSQMSKVVVEVKEEMAAKEDNDGEQDE